MPVNLPYYDTLQGIFNENVDSDYNNFLRPRDTSRSTFERIRFRSNDQGEVTDGYSTAKPISHIYL
jgi:hypothetical protein